jgi:hypothetical protein
LPYVYVRDKCAGAGVAGLTETEARRIAEPPELLKRQDAG